MLGDAITSKTTEEEKTAKTEIRTRTTFARLQTPQTNSKNRQKVSSTRTTQGPVLHVCKHHKNRRNSQTESSTGTTFACLQTAQKNTTKQKVGQGQLLHVCKQRRGAPDSPLLQLLRQDAHYANGGPTIHGL